MVRPHSAPDLAVPSAPPSALWIFRQIAGAPSAPLTAAIVGPGGTGKSVLLDALAREYQKAGAVVVRGNPTAGLRLDTLDPNEPVLVDDAHQLDQAMLNELRTFAEGETTRLVVAYRPWPRCRELSALGASLARRRSPVVVGHLDRGNVGTRIAARVGCTPPDSLIDLVHEQTGGLPSLVNLVTQALQDTGRFDPRRPEQFRRPERVNVSAGLAERLRYQLEALDPEIYRLLQAMAVGAALDADVLGPLLDADPAALTDTVEAAMATGLLTSGGELIPFIRNIVLRLMPMLRSREMQRQLATIQLDRGGSVLAAGRQLLGTGASGTRVAAVLERAGDEAMRQSPTLAAELYAGTIDAGASPSALGARHAQAVALAGDLDQALRLADQVVSDPSAPDRQRGVAVVAAILAHRGLPAHSAQLYCSMPADAGGGAVLAVPALIGIGELAQAHAVLDGADAGTGRGATLMAGAEILMARGMLATVTGTATEPTTGTSTSTGALSQLARATVLLEPAGETVLLPDTPAALTAVVALQCGELTVADSTLRRAVAAKLGGRPAHPRHLLLHGWMAMVRGKLDVAHRTLNRVTRKFTPLEPRDEVVAAALAVGLARREGDAAALRSAWRRARCALVRHPIDLYMLQPLGELAIAAARSSELESVAPHLKEAENLLDKLGDPVLWAAPLHWHQMHAAIVAQDLTEAQRHAAALTAASTAASSSPYVAVLAAAASSWLQVLSGEIDPETVQTVARRLHGVGLAWDAAQLAAQAATRTTDRRAISALLTCARALNGSLPSGADSSAGSGEELDPETSSQGRSMNAAPAPAETTVAAGSGPVEVQSILSERELEVGQLILAGLTHKQVGERLFISAKTVEHHMARIRQRLGVGTRNELFDQLRSLIEGS
ncbi:MAG: LuxR C-terminal-related transcriptional regulator [Actinomycetota bacterium]|nr:LuxR C-terminal-related transcriptional regulator [Actinomycetota bacterium]